MSIFLTLPNDWKNVLNQELQKSYIKDIDRLLTNEYTANIVYPLRSQIFEAFRQTPWEKISVVILGQDPYHQPGQAHGLAFSVPIHCSIPPSLQNIFKEISTDIGPSDRCCGDLTYLAEQGVLLLNSILTVRANTPRSHKHIPWENFTNAVISTIVKRNKNLVFMLWGNDAQQKQSLISGNHLILTTSHPSPLSAHRGFIGCKHFSLCNAYLKTHHKKTINW